MNFKLYVGVLVLALMSTVAWAQTVSGTVTDENNQPLPGATVVVQGTNTGTTSDFDGNYQISATQGQTLVFSYVGYATQNVVVSAATHNVSMQTDNALDEVVLTGVATGTSTRKLGFTVSKISEEGLQDVPASDPGNALRAKVAGIRVVQASGNPSSAPEIRLRGSTSISGNQSPLYIVDGVILENTIRDINVEDIRSVEVVKGAAGSSLYGSLAGNGVIQYFTYRGKGVSDFKVTLRSEAGWSELPSKYPISKRHNYELNSDGTFAFNSANQLQSDDDGLKDNLYPTSHDNLSEILTSQPTLTNYVSISKGTENFNFHASAQNTEVGGLISSLPPYVRKNFRLNADYREDKFDFSSSISYAKSKGISIQEQGQGANIFYSVLIAEPFVNLSEKDGNGNYVSEPTGFNWGGGSNIQNPLYVGRVAKFDLTGERLLGRFAFNYHLNKNLTFSAAQSIDRRDTRFYNYYPKGFETPTPGTLNEGFILKTNGVNELVLSEASLNYKKDFGDFLFGATLKYQFENRKRNNESASGREFFALGVESLQNTQQDTRTITSISQKEVAENIFLNLDLDYQDKIILNALGRRDKSSLFGSENREKYYGRVSLAYILTEDLEIDNVDFLKLRLSYGTSGNRPPVWNAQYETYQVTSASISPGILGNNELKPSTVSEYEFGADFEFFNNSSKLEITYSLQNVEDDHLLVPLSAPAGFSSQWKNIGNLKATSFEVGLSSDIINKDEFRWNANLLWDKVTQEITDLGEVPPFTRQINNTAVNIFRVEENKPYGTLYGNVLAKNLSDLTVNDDGVVLNGGGSNNLSAYSINNNGHVVLTSAIGTENEQALVILDPNTNTPLVKDIGNTNPDFNVGFSNRFYFKNFSLYTLVDWQQGGDIYNFSKQLIYFNERHADQDNFAKQEKHINYSNGASTIYNQSNPIDYFVEDGTYVKVREISLSYTLRDHALKKTFGKHIDRVRISASGRNLFTFTNYTGWDPEVAIGTNPTNFRLDEFSYPNFRSYTVSINIDF